MARYFRCDYCGQLTNLDQRPRPPFKATIHWLPLYELTSATLAKQGVTDYDPDEPHELVTLAAYCGPACAAEAFWAERAGTMTGGS
jgi:hypothetical protein